MKLHFICMKKVSNVPAISLDEIMLIKTKQHPHTYLAWLSICGGTNQKIARKYEESLSGR